MLFAEHRLAVRGVPDLLLYDSLVDDGIMLLTDGSLLAGWRFRGPDLDSATHDQMAALSARLNSILRLGSGWMVQAEAIRSSAPEYPRENHFVSPVAMLIDVERHQQFARAGQHFETEYFLTLTYQPPRLREEKVRGFLFDDSGAVQQGSAARALEAFRAKITTFEDILASIVWVERLRSETRLDENGEVVKHDQLLRYLRRCVTGQDHPFELPEIPSYLSDLIATVDTVGGLEPELGDQHLRIVAIDGFPRKSRPGILRALDSLPMEYRWSTRALLLDPEEARALLDGQRKRWRSKIRGMKEQVLRNYNGPVDRFAQEMALDAEDAMSEASAGDVQFCFYTSLLLVTGATERDVDSKAGLAIKTIRNLGFGARLENVNAMDAWRGSLPGDGYCNIRRPLIHTLNLADMLPVTAVWAGERVNPSPLMPAGSPPLFYAATGGATPFRFNLHVGDVGHALMVGPTGAGKSTFLAFAVAQWFRYKNAQVFAFDKGRALQVLCASLEGSFYDIGEGTDLSFCPLRDLETAGDFAWAVDWLEVLCNLMDKRLVPSERSALVDAVGRLRLDAPENRTLTALQANVQDHELRELLKHFCLGGPIGHLLDSSTDSLGAGRFLAFEMEHLLPLSDKAVVPVLLYLFRQITKRLTGAPTLIPIDEAWIFLAHELFRERVREILKTIRNLNGTVLLCTQNSSDIATSPIKDVILENCPTRVLLANPEAANPSARAFYQSIGLNPREIDIVQRAIPKREYYVVSPMGRRKISLGLNGVALSFVGVSGREERQAALALRQQLGDNWIGEWLRRRQLPEWATFYEEGQAAGARGY